MPPFETSLYQRTEVDEETGKLRCDLFSLINSAAVLGETEFAKKYVQRIHALGKELGEDEFGCALPGDSRREALELLHSIKGLQIDELLEERAAELAPAINSCLIARQLGRCSMEDCTGRTPDEPAQADTEALYIEEYFRRLDPSIKL